MIAFLAAGALAADCPSPVPPESWAQELAAAERGYAALDSDAFEDHVDAATLDLPCLAAVVPPSDAARYHALMALRFYAHGDIDSAADSFASARAADPTWALPEAVVPAGHEVRRSLSVAAVVEREALAPPDGVTIWLDGTRADQRPTTHPVIAQVVGGGGEVRTSAYVAPGRALPDYPIVAATVVVAPVPVVPAPGPAPMPRPLPSEPRSPKWGYLAGAGVAGGLSGVLYAFAADGAAKFAAPLEPDVGREELLGLRNRTNGCVIGSVAAGTVAAASATLFVVLL